VRLTIGRIDPEDEEIEFVDTMMSPERSIFSSKKLIPGEYIILVEVYWEQETHNDITLGTYSQGPVILEKLKKNENLYNMSEYMIWKCFANQKRGELTKMNPNYIYDKGVNVSVEANKYKNQNYAMVLYDYRNTSQEMTAHQVVGISKSSGFNIVSAAKNKNNCDLIMNPGENDVILFKMDPRSQGFSLSHRVVQEELLEKSFSKPYLSAFEMLNELGSIDANPNKPKPKPAQPDMGQLGGLTNHLKDKLEEEQRRKAQMEQEQQMRSKAEKIRKMKEAEEERKRRIELQRQKQYEKSKIGRYDPMNFISGFGGGIGEIMKLLEGQGFNKTNKQKHKQYGRGGNWFMNNFSGLRSRGGRGGGFGQFIQQEINRFGGGGGTRGFGLGGGRGFGGMGGGGGIFGGNTPFTHDSSRRHGGGGRGRGGKKKGGRQKSWGGQGHSSGYQRVVYTYGDGKNVTQGGYTYNLSNTGGKSKINKDHSGKKSVKKSGTKKGTEKKIVDPLNGKNSIFKKGDSHDLSSEEPQIKCGCI
jgi:hypothetical protein